MSISKEVQISNALAILGHAPIISLDDGDDLTVAAEQAYDMLLPSVLSQSNWRFAVQIQQLAKTVDTLPSLVGWEAVYNLPADFIKTIRLWPMSYEWEIYENKKLYANFTGDMYMEYVYQPLPSKLPAYFVNYFVYEIAAYLALSNAQKAEFYNVLESKRTLAQGQAAAADAQNRPNSSQVDIPVLNQRYVGGFISNFE